MYGANCWTDHRLVVSKLNLRIQPARRPQGKKVQVGNGQEQAQSERNFHSNNRGGKETELTDFHKYSAMFR